MLLLFSASVVVWGPTPRKNHPQAAKPSPTKQRQAGKNRPAVKLCGVGLADILIFSYLYETAETPHPDGWCIRSCRELPSHPTPRPPRYPTTRQTMNIRIFRITLLTLLSVLTISSVNAASTVQGRIYLKDGRIIECGRQTAASCLLQGQEQGGLPLRGD